MTRLLSIYHHPITVETSGSYLHWEWDVGEGQWNAGQEHLKAEPETRMWSKEFTGRWSQQTPWGDREGKEESCYTDSLKLSPLGSSGGQDRVSPPEVFKQQFLSITGWGLLGRACKLSGTSHLPWKCFHQRAAAGAGTSKRTLHTWH